MMGANNINSERNGQERLPGIISASGLSRVGYGALNDL
jgi:hypothetical protein